MITTGNIQKCTPHLQVIMQSTKCQLAIGNNLVSMHATISPATTP
ncbi:hypothetical protein THERMOT_328 [Bathymodiolus thermophilus thioautotrophic gill symbiont]|nr:hypothetical protein THERMOT_328 [Bathymodiolus thermophilus thioautotrophic gill symbiont]